MMTIFEKGCLRTCISDRVWATSTFSRVGSLSSNSLRMHVYVIVYSTGIIRNELRICGYAIVVHTSGSFCTHTHIPFEDRELTGLKVVIADKC